VRAVPNRALPGLTLDELAAALGSRTRALGALNWLCGRQTYPAALPETVPGVSARVWRPFVARLGLVTRTIASRS
jgi:hypothetical protein